MAAYPYCFLSANIFQLIAFGLSFAICFGTRFGLGRHEDDVPIAWKPTLKRCEYAFSVLYVSEPQLLCKQSG